MTQQGRWPSWVYVEAEEPDYRFSFANERTFLAWIRTSLALLAGGIAVDVLDLDVSDNVQRLLAVLLVALGMLSALIAWIRWAVSERAIRRREPLPSLGFALIFSIGLVTVGLVLLLLAW